MRLSNGGIGDPLQAPQRTSLNPWDSNLLVVGQLCNQRALEQGMTMGLPSELIKPNASLFR